jgi:hypothetical protein
MKWDTSASRFSAYADDVNSLGDNIGLNTIKKKQKL